jgi:hypothetical protein
VTACVVLCFFFEIEKSRLPFWGPIRNPWFALTTKSQVFHEIDSVNLSRYVNSVYAPIKIIRKKTPL